MPNPEGGRQSLTAKILIISAIGIGVGFGTCSLTLIKPGGATALSNFATSAGLILFFTSLAVFVITALIALGMKIVRSSQK